MKTNALSKTPGAKLIYLYAFEALFSEKCKAAGVNPSRWAQGMWTNAHMHYGNGASVEEGVERWFAHVKSVEKPEPRNYSVDKSALPA